MTVFLDKNGLVSALEQMTVPLAAFIKELGIDAVQLPHADGEIAVRGFNKQMIMVGHEAVGVTNPIVPLVDVLEGIEKIDPNLVVFENGFLFIPSGSNVINSAGIFDAKWPCHGLKKACLDEIVNTKDLTLWVWV